MLIEIKKSRAISAPSFINTEILAIKNNPLALPFEIMLCHATERNKANNLEPCPAAEYVKCWQPIFFYFWWSQPFAHTTSMLAQPHFYIPPISMLVPTSMILKLKMQRAAKLQRWQQRLMVLKTSA